MNEIWRYIALDSVRNAELVKEAILGACELVGKMPHIGHKRSSKTSRALLFWEALPYPNYLIAYDPNSQPVRIIAVLHGAREKLPQ